MIIVASGAVLLLWLIGTTLLGQRNDFRELEYRSRKEDEMHSQWLRNHDVRLFELEKKLKTLSAPPAPVKKKEIKKQPETSRFNNLEE